MLSIGFLHKPHTYRYLLPLRPLGRPQPTLPTRRSAWLGGSKRHPIGVNPVVIHPWSINLWRSRTVGAGIDYHYHRGRLMSLRLPQLQSRCPPLRPKRLLFPVRARPACHLSLVVLIRERTETVIRTARITENWSCRSIGSMVGGMVGASYITSFGLYTTAHPRLIVSPRARSIYPFHLDTKLVSLRM